MNMRKIYPYCLAALLLVTACKKELTQNPYNAIPNEQAFNTPEDFTNAVRGAYAAFRDYQVRNSDGTLTRTADYYGGEDNGSMASTPDILADNLILNQQGRKSQQTYFNYKYQANATWSLWANAYAVIVRANFVLVNIDHLPDGAFKENVRGEALAIRALAHFDLLRVYAKAYASATDADLGVPYVTSVDPAQLPARTPLKAAYALVVDDLGTAVAGIAQDNGEGRLNKAAVEGLLSRVYLYMGLWQKAADAATAAIADAPAANALAGTADFAAIWRDETEKDVLFKIKILDADDATIGVAYEQASPAGVKPEYSVDYGLFNLYAANDVRKNAYIGQTIFNGVAYNYVKKYVGRAQGNANVVDFKVIRMGEVYLNRAEAYYNLGNAPAALADLNTLRANRYTGFVAGTEGGAALASAIQLQRRLELAFEGARFFDLKRRNQPVERPAFGDEADGGGIPASVRSLPAGSPLFQLPIPQAELNANKNIVQNEGY
jgi:hypothetical protein